MNRGQIWENIVMDQTLEEEDEIFRVFTYSRYYQ